jgi:hypothetical protein
LGVAVTGGDAGAGAGADGADGVVPPPFVGADPPARVVFVDERGGVAPGTTAGSMGLPY